jgi:hypothetical protein
VWVWVCVWGGGGGGEGGWGGGLPPLGAPPLGNFKFPPLLNQGKISIKSGFFFARFARISLIKTFLETFLETF